MNNKINNLNNVSNIDIVKKKALKIYGTSDVEPSTRKYKKYMIKKPDGKYIHFGDIRYEDFTHHKNKQRQDNYLKRAVNMHGNWINNIWSPNWLSILLLW